MQSKRIIEIVPYDSDWVKEYEAEKSRIARILADENIRIHHIGSTSVPGLPSKPTIDIMIEIDNLVTIDSYNEQFEKLGYSAKGEMGVDGRRYFSKKKGEIHTHHIHVYRVSSRHVKRHLAFKRLLIENSEIRGEYGRLKIEAAGKFAEEPEKYTEYKNAFIMEKEQDALKLYYPE